MVARERLASGVPGHRVPEDALALWCAIVADPEVAREFELDSHVALDLLCVVLMPHAAGPAQIN